MHCNLDVSQVRMRGPEIAIISTAHARRTCAMAGYKNALRSSPVSCDLPDWAWVSTAGYEGLVRQSFYCFLLYALYRQKTHALGLGVATARRGKLIYKFNDIVNIHSS